MMPANNDGQPGACPYGQRYCIHLQPGSAIVGAEEHPTASGSNKRRVQDAKDVELSMLSLVLFGVVARCDPEAVGGGDGRSPLLSGGEGDGLSVGLDVVVCGLVPVPAGQVGGCGGWELLHVVEGVQELFGGQRRLVAIDPAFADLLWPAPG